VAKPSADRKKPLNRAKRMAAAPKKTALVTKAAPRKATAGKTRAYKRTGSNTVKTVAVAKKDLAKSAKPSFFRMRTQLVDMGNTELPLVVGDNLWIKIKVYAQGGENHLHAHPYQDHSFIVLDGQCCFHGPRGEKKMLKEKDGIFLPAGSYYWFEQVGKKRLVVLRLGATKPGGHPDSRVMPDGSWQVRRGRAEVFKSKDVAYRKGAFYG
jgi:quercetin dioxygenase-like cupin family protein